LNDGPAAAKTASSPGLAPAAGRLALSAEPIRVAALGYVTSNGAARLHDAHVVDQLWRPSSIQAAVGSRRQLRATARRGGGEVKRGNRVEGGR
jgi:hypothetical protein